MSVDHNLRIILLGGFDVRLNGRPITGFTYNKMRALLAYLAVEQEQDHNREFLSELLWGGNDSVAARDNLRRALSSLRRVLESPAKTTLFSVTKNTIRFIPNAYIDTKEFLAQPSTASKDSAQNQHREEEISTLYQGELLAGLFLPDSPDFEDWLQIQREFMRRRALALLEKLSNHYAQIGDYNKALEFTLRHTELEPWDENVHSRAMRLFSLNGQNSAALQQYETCCLLLKKELGILPNEKTRRLAEQIRNGTIPRRSTDSLADAPQDAPSVIVQPQKKPDEATQNGRFSTFSGELRLVTVLYCELIPAAYTDIDEYITPLYLVQSRCLEIVRQFSGYTVQAHGGGILAYFGYPQAHEHAARYAVQAALEISRETSRIIEIRASIHTGLIITGNDPAMPDSVGKTTKLAIKLNHHLSHSGVLISQETYNLVSGFFECVSRGVLFFPDLAGHMEIFKAIQKRSAPVCPDSMALKSPMVGRKTELAELMNLWKKSTQGERQVVSVHGEAGVGKSRLVHSLKEQLVGQAHAIRQLRCFPEFCQSPFHPLIAMFEAMLGISHHDSHAVKHEKIVTYVNMHYPEAIDDAVPMLTRLLSLPVDEQCQSFKISGQQQKELTNAILLSTLEALSVLQPVLLIVEDLQWIDPSTLDFLSLLVEQKNNGAILALFTARPEFVPPWDRAGTTTITLEALCGSEVAAIITALNNNIPAKTLRCIVDRSDGIPLFAEEIAKFTGSDDQLCIPTTLHDLLIMRLDNLGEAKYTAQLAATIGREFDVQLLSMIAPFDRDELTRNLSVLQNAGLILKVNDEVYQFKHALIQEVAYHSQAKADRQATHQRVAQALQSDFPVVVSTQPELLAHHLCSGGATLQSIEYWLEAGQRAAMNSANTEAIEHFTNGLQLLMTQPPGKECIRLEFKLQINLGTAITNAKGYSCFEANQAYSRAQQLAECLEGNTDFFKAFWDIWLTSSARIYHLHSLELAQTMLKLAEYDNDALKLQAAHYALGHSALMIGKLNAARAHLEHAITLYQPALHEVMISLCGLNIFVSGNSLLTLVQWLQGFPEQALKLSEETLASARKLQHPNSLGYALCIAAKLNRWMKRVAVTESLAKEAMALSDQHNLLFWKELSASCYNWAEAMQGQAEASSQIQRRLNIVNTLMNGAKILLLEPLSEILIHQEQFDNGIARVDEALQIIQTKDNRFFESEFHRLKGVCLLGLSETNAKEAEAYFNQALDISRKQKAKSLELRAAISMARLWRQRGERRDAQQLLTEVYSSFTEGFDSFDLQEAAELIRLLA